MCRVCGHARGIWRCVLVALLARRPQTVRLHAVLRERLVDIDEALADGHAEHGGVHGLHGRVTLERVLLTVALGVPAGQAKQKRSRLVKARPRS